MLLEYTGYCSCRQYMLKKSGRCDLKFWVLSDGASHYCYNAPPYFWKEVDQQTTILGSKVVQKLVSPTDNSGRSITFDHYTTNFELFETLCSSHKTKYVFTLAGTSENKTTNSKILKN